MSAQFDQRNENKSVRIKYLNFGVFGKQFLFAKVGKASEHSPLGCPNTSIWLQFNKNLGLWEKGKN